MFVHATKHAGTYTDLETLREYTVDIKNEATQIQTAHNPCCYDIGRHHLLQTACSH